MPSPKAVLRDIAEFGLDPSKPYVVGKNGRLNATPKVSGPKYTLGWKPTQSHVEVEKVQEPAEIESKVEVEQSEPQQDVTQAGEVTKDDVASDDSTPVTKKGKKSKASS